MTQTNRDEIRAEMRRRRAALHPDDRERAALALARRLLATRFYRSASRIGAYLSVGAEIDIDSVISRAWQQGKQVYVPVVDASGEARMRFARLHPDTPLICNRYGISEPHPDQRDFLEPQWLDLVLVPLVAFDKHGNRLGMGGGYYDQCFAFLRHRMRWKKPRLCGVAYAFQQAEKIEHREWDVPLANVVTDNSVIMVSTTGNKI